MQAAIDEMVACYDKIDIGPLLIAAYEQRDLLTILAMLNEAWNCAPESRDTFNLPGANDVLWLIELDLLTSATGETDGEPTVK